MVFGKKKRPEIASGTPYRDQLNKVRLHNINVFSHPDARASELDRKYGGPNSKEEASARDQLLELQEEHRIQYSMDIDEDEYIDDISTEAREMLMTKLARMYYYLPKEKINDKFYEELRAYKEGWCE